MLLRKQLPAFQTVTAGKVNSCFIPDGEKVHAIFLEVGDDNGLQVPSGNLLDDISVVANKAVQRKCTALQLAQLNSRFGAKYALQESGTPGTAAFRSYLPIWFSTPWVEPRSAGNALGWNCQKGTGLRLDVEIQSGVTNPVLQGWYYYSELDGGFGAIEKWVPQPIQISGLANEHTTLQVKELLQSLHFFPTAAGIYVNSFKVTRGTGNVLVDEITHLQNQAALIGYGQQPDTSAAPRYDALFDQEDPQDLGLPVGDGKNLVFKTSYSASASGTMDTLAVILGRPE